MLKVCETQPLSTIAQCRQRYLERIYPMKKLLCCLAIATCVFVSGCTTNTKNIVYQTSTIDALLAGVYDGDLSIGQLKEHGDFGIGTFDRLDGEMILLDGRIYQVRADGKVYSPKLRNKTPFATVCRFTSEKKMLIREKTDYPSLIKLLDEKNPNNNLFYAVKVTGKFNRMKTRSVPAQKKPYPTLKEATSNQPEFPMKNISGTIVGFRCPPYVKGINVPGYHLHFISSDHTRGGHVLSFEMAQGICEIDILDQYFLKLPAGTEDFARTDLSKDRGKELEDVEK